MESSLKTKRKSLWEITMMILTIFFLVFVVLGILAGLLVIVLLIQTYPYHTLSGVALVLLISVVVWLAKNKRDKDGKLDFGYLGWVRDATADLAYSTRDAINKMSFRDMIAFVAGSLIFIMALANVTSDFLDIAGMAILAVSFLRMSLVWRAETDRERKNAKIVVLALVAFLGFGILDTHVRGGFLLAVAIALLFALLVYPRKKSSDKDVPAETH